MTNAEINLTIYEKIEKKCVHDYMPVFKNNSHGISCKKCPHEILHCDGPVDAEKWTEKHAKDIPNYLEDDAFCFSMIHKFNMTVKQDCTDVRAFAEKSGGRMGLCEINGWTPENIRRAILIAVKRCVEDD